MNGTTDTADFISERREFSDLQRLSGLSFNNLAKVSNNLEGYFLFCLFGLAILALFLCRSSMQALPSSLFFFVLRRQVWQVLYINKFLQRGPGTLDFKWQGWSNGGKNQNPKKSLDQNLASKQSHAKFPSHKNFQKALNDIPSGYSYGTRASTCICYSHGILAKLIRVKHWQYWLGLNHAIICLHYYPQKVCNLHM